MDSSKYNAKTTAAEIAAGFNLQGKNVIVTGGYSGIGRETARVLADRGASVIVAGRDMAKCNRVVQELKDQTAMELDLASLASVRAFADNFHAFGIPLHLLINNAGVMCCPKGKTVDGFETQMGTNHFGHFLLTNLLLPHLIEGAPSRVVNVSSAAYVAGEIRWDDLHWDKGCYGKWQAYGQSKLANILFTLEFNRRYRDRGVTSNTLHPGIISTELQRHERSMINISMVKAMPKFIKYAGGTNDRKTIPQGASTTIFAALHPLSADGGKFYNHCQEMALTPFASNLEDARRLWDVSARLVGLPNES